MAVSRSGLYGVRVIYTDGRSYLYGPYGSRAEARASVPAAGGRVRESHVVRFGPQDRVSGPPRVISQTVLREPVVTPPEPPVPALVSVSATGNEGEIEVIGTDLDLATSLKIYSTGGDLIFWPLSGNPTNEVLQSPLLSAATVTAVELYDDYPPTVLLDDLTGLSVDVAGPPVPSITSASISGTTISVVGENMTLIPTGLQAQVMALGNLNFNYAGVGGQYSYTTISDTLMEIELDSGYYPDPLLPCNIRDVDQTMDRVDFDHVYQHDDVVAVLGEPWSATICYADDPGGSYGGIHVRGTDIDTNMTAIRYITDDGSTGGAGGANVKRDYWSDDAYIQWTFFDPDVPTYIGLDDASGITRQIIKAPEGGWSPANTDPIIWLGSRDRSPDDAHPEVVLYGESFGDPLSQVDLVSGDRIELTSVDLTGTTLTVQGYGLDQISSWGFITYDQPGYPDGSFIASFAANPSLLTETGPNQFELVYADVSGLSYAYGNETNIDELHVFLQQQRLAVYDFNTLSFSGTQPRSGDTTATVAGDVEPGSWDGDEDGGCRVYAPELLHAVGASFIRSADGRPSKRPSYDSDFNFVLTGMDPTENLTLEEYGTPGTGTFRITGTNLLRRYFYFYDAGFGFHGGIFGPEHSSWFSDNVGYGATFSSWTDTEVIGTVPGLSGNTIDRIIVNSHDDSYQLNQAGFGVTFS